MIISVAQFQYFFLIVTRILIILVQIPFLGGSNVPNQFKLALGVLLSLIVFPWEQTAEATQVIPLLAFAGAILQELIVGLLTGFAATLTFAAFQTAAKIMELGSGFTAGQVFNPTIGDIGSAFDQFFLLIVTLYFFITNGHHVFLMGIMRSFDVFPVMGTLETISLDRVIYYFALFFSFGVQIALPVFGAILLADLSLGLLAKVSPQIQVFFLGLPIKVWLGVVGLMLSIQVFAPRISTLFSEMGQRMLALLGA